MCLFGGRLEERYSSSNVFSDLTNQYEWAKWDYNEILVIRLDTYHKRDSRSCRLAACCLGLLNAFWLKGLNRGWNVREGRGGYKYSELGGQ